MKVELFRDLGLHLSWKVKELCPLATAALIVKVFFLFRELLADQTYRTDRRISSGPALGRAGRDKY